MPDTKKDASKMILELVPCSRCGNPFMKKKEFNRQELICDNCIKLEQRKCELQLEVTNNVIASNKVMETSINEMKSQLTVAKGQFNKQAFLDKIKKRSQALTKSIDLLQKIEESNDEKFIDEYKKLFDKLKKEDI